MATVKLGWAGLTVPDKIVKTISVVDCIEDSSSVYSAPEPPMPILRAKALELLTAEASALRGGTDRTIARNAVLDQLTEMMNHLVNYVQFVSLGDPVKVALAGLDTADEPSPWPIPERVGNAQARPGGNPGTVVLTWNKVKYNKSYVIEIWKVLDPMNPAKGVWVPTTVYKLEHTFMGLVSGQSYRFRVAAQNSAGMGDYSEEATTVAR